MSILTTVIVVATLLISVSFAILKSEISIVFSGALVAVTVMWWYVAFRSKELQERVVSLQLAFNSWTQDRVAAREDPELIVHGKPRYETGGTANSVKIELRVSNPGDVLMSVDNAQILDAAIANPTATALEWYSEYPLLSQATPPDRHVRHGFPAPVFAGGLTRLVIEFAFDSDERYNAARNLRTIPFLLMSRVGNADTAKPLNITLTR